MEKIKINTPTIQLDQFLKWAGALQSGGEIKILLEEQRIKRNGVIETAKRRKLVPGDVIEIEGAGTYTVAADDSSV
jgi:ribosome-associated protein